MAALRLPRFQNRTGSLRLCAGGAAFALALCCALPAFAQVIGTVRQTIGGVGGIAGGVVGGAGGVVGGAAGVAGGAAGGVSGAGARSGGGSVSAPVGSGRIRVQGGGNPANAYGAAGNTGGLSKATSVTTRGGRIFLGGGGSVAPAPQARTAPVVRARETKSQIKSAVRAIETKPIVREAMRAATPAVESVGAAAANTLSDTRALLRDTTASIAPAGLLALPATVTGGFFAVSFEPSPGTQPSDWLQVSLARSGNGPLSDPLDFSVAVRNNFGARAFNAGALPDPQTIRALTDPQLRTLFASAKQNECWRDLSLIAAPFDTLRPANHCARGLPEKKNYWSQTLSNLDYDTPGLSRQLQRNLQVTVARPVRTVSLPQAPRDAIVALPPATAPDVQAPAPQDARIPGESPPSKDANAVDSKTADAPAPALPGAKPDRSESAKSATNAPSVAAAPKPDVSEARKATADAAPSVRPGRDDADAAGKFTGDAAPPVRADRSGDDGARKFAGDAALTRTARGDNADSVKIALAPPPLVSGKPAESAAGKSRYAPGRIVVLRADPADMGKSDVESSLPMAQRRAPEPDAQGESWTPPEQRSMRDIANGLLFDAKAMAAAPGKIEPFTSTEEPSLMARLPSDPALAPIPELLRGKDGARIASPAQMLSLVGESRTGAEQCLTSAIYFEARSEVLEGQIAVAQVVLNRVFSGYFPKDVCGVVYQNAHRHLACQFSFACTGLTFAIGEREMWDQAQRIAKAMLDGRVWLADIGKSTHYHAYWVQPSWVREMREIHRVGDHTFYRPKRWGDGEREPSWTPTPAVAEVIGASARR